MLTQGMDDGTMLVRGFGGGKLRIMWYELVRLVSTITRIVTLRSDVDT